MSAASRPASAEAAIPRIVRVLTLARPSDRAVVTRYPGEGLHFTARYRPERPDQFVIVADDNSEFARSLRCGPLNNAISAARKQSEFCGRRSRISAAPRGRAACGYCMLPQRNGLAGQDRRRIWSRCRHSQVEARRTMSYATSVDGDFTTDGDPRPVARTDLCAALSRRWRHRFQATRRKNDTLPPPPRHVRGQRVSIFPAPRELPGDT